MPLREFDRVRERLEFRLEKRHLVWLSASLVVVLLATFVGGWILASKVQAPPSTPPPPQATKWVSLKRLPAPTQRNIQTRRLPVVPRARNASKRRMVPLYALRPSRHSTASQRTARSNRAALAVEENEHGPNATEARKRSPVKRRAKIGVRELAILEALDDRPGAVPELPADWVQSQSPRQNAWSQSSWQDRTWAHEISVASWVDAEGAALATAAVASGQSWTQPERNSEAIERQDQLRFIHDIDAARAKAAAQARALAEAKAKAEAEAKARAQAQAAARKAAAEAKARAAAQAAQALREALAAKAKAAAEAKAKRQQELAAERARKEQAKRIARLQRLPAPKAKAAPASTIRTSKAPTKRKVYWVQLKSLRDAVEAQAFMQSMRTKGYRAKIFKAQVKGLGTVHRIRVGPFLTLSDTKMAAKRIESREGFEVIPITLLR